MSLQASTPKFQAGSLYSLSAVNGTVIQQTRMSEKARLRMKRFLAVRACELKRTTHPTLMLAAVPASRMTLTAREVNIHTHSSWWGRLNKLSERSVP